MELINVIEEGSCSNSKPDETTYMAEVSEKLVSIVDQPSTYIESVIEDIEEVYIDPSNPNHKVLIGSRLDAVRRQKLIVFLAEHMDYFVWSHEDITGIDPSPINHHAPT